MVYIFFGSMAILVWKCGTQLLKEAKYKTIVDDEETKRKEQLRLLAENKKN